MCIRDRYKDSLKLKLDVDNKTAFADWAENKSSMTVKLGRGEKSTVIASDDVSIDIENETLLSLIHIYQTALRCLQPRRRSC